jgi:hypothetical protein
MGYWVPDMEAELAKLKAKKEAARLQADAPAAEPEEGKGD